MTDRHAPVGIIANPFSARDIRRLIASAGSLQIADRANIVLRVLASLGATGVCRVLMMPDNGGITALLKRALQREYNLARQPWPALELITMPVNGTVNDTHRAVEIMVERGVQVIVVLGGDGTSRAVASRCGTIPIAGLSTGTNNAFPDLREPTITGLAIGLYASGQIAAEQMLIGNKILEIDVNNGAFHDWALVDITVTNEPCVGARALWRTDSLRELFVTFATPEAIGLSAIAGLLMPVGRTEPHGVYAAHALP
ncbi:MAG: NAD(+)/NADH kinase [Candidatus Competibacteraceae bacterium]